MPNAQTGSSSEAKSLLQSFIARPHLLFLIILPIAFTAYSNTFKVPFMFDDSLIPENPVIRNLSNIPDIIFGGGGSLASRPLMLITLAINYYFSGLDPWSYHAVNLCLHFTNAILLYSLVSMTGKYIGYDVRTVRLAGIMASLFFTLHPIQTQGVTYVLSRSMLMATTFYLLGMILFLKMATVQRRRGFYIAWLFVVSLLGMGSRENFATFPVMLVLYDLFFISKFRLRKAAGHWKAYLPVIISLGYLAAIVLSHTYDRLSEKPGAGIPHLDYFFTEFNVHWTYLRLLLLPINQNVDYGYPIASTLFELPTIFSFLSYFGLWTIMAILARIRPATSFCVLWFLVALLPISFGVTLMDLRLDDVIFEHRFYLPGAGLFVAAGMGLAFVITKWETRKTAAAPVAISIILALLLATATYHRNAVWVSPQSFWGDSLKKSPLNARPRFKLGNFYRSNNRIEEAVELYNEALEIYPGYVEVHNNLGVIYYTDLGMREKAMDHFNSAIRLNPLFVEAHFNLGMMYVYENRPDKAREKFETVLMLDPHYPEAAMWMRYVRKMTGQSADDSDVYRDKALQSE